MNKKTFVFVSLLALGLVVFVVVFLSLDLGKILQQLEKLKLWHFLVFFAVSISNFLLMSMRWKVILATLGHKVPLLKLALHYLSGYAVSFVTPVARVGGEPVRIYFLREEERVRLRDATSSVLTDKAVELIMLILFGIGGMSFAVAFDFAPPELFYTLISVASLIALGAFYVVYRLVTGKGFFTPLARILNIGNWEKLSILEEKIGKVEGQIMDFFRDDRPALIWALLLSFVSTSIMVFEFWLGAKFFGVDLTFTQAFIVMAISGLAYLVPVPAGVGMFEGSQAAVAIWFGIPPEKLVAVAVLIRMRDILFTAGGISHLIRHGALGLLSSAKKDPVHTNAKVPFLESKILAKHAEITHGFFNRNGGVSERPYDTLNVRFGIGDDDTAVRENRERVRTALELDQVASADQTHSDNIIVVTGKEKRELADADVLITQTPGVGVMIQTADCQPILLYDPEHKVIAAVHAGWKGSVKNILGKTIKYLQKHFDTDPKKLVGAVGPSICVQNYEFKNAHEKLPKGFHDFLDSEGHLDLLSVTEEQWIKAGGLINNLEIMRVCVADDTDYFSHRRDRGDTGRQASVIGLRIE